MTSMLRRAGVLAAAAFVLLGAAGPSADVSLPIKRAPRPAATPIPGSLPPIPEIVSRDRALTFNVVAKVDATSGNPVLSYNGSEVPPTLRLLPGDTLYVNLTNDLPTPPNGAGYLNDTSLHYHGLHVSPNAPADDSIDMIAMPGQSLHYVVPIPQTHQPGLYWYHSHAHGEAERQNLSGMSGALVIDGIASQVPAVANLAERIIVVRDTEPAGTVLPNAVRRQVDAMNWAMSHTNVPRRASMSGMSGMSRMSMDAQVRGRTNLQTRNPYVVTYPGFRRFDRRRLAADTHCTGMETPAKNVTLNGAMQPTIGIRPGETQFWRVVNAGSDTFLNLAIDNATMNIFSIDGVPIQNGQNVTSPLSVGQYTLPPASRVEFTVTGPASGTTSYVRTTCYDAGATGDAMPAQILGVIDPNHGLGTPHERGRPLARRVANRGLSAARLRYAAVTDTRTLYYGDQNTIDGTTYDPSGPAPYYVQSGTVAEWTIANTSSLAHTFHIHQVHMLVEAINGIAQSQEYLVDNVTVPPATASGPATVKVLIDFTDPLIVGTFLLHCHILSHEDAGMMAKIRVGTAPPLKVKPASLTFSGPGAASQTSAVTGGAAPYSLSGCGGVATASISGSTATVVPTGSGSCQLIVADATGLTASVAVTVMTPVTVSVSPNALSFASTSAAAQTATISNGVAPYAVSGCGGVAAASISSSTLTVSPAGVGSCTLAVTDSAGGSANVSVGVNAAQTGVPADNVTFHHDTARTGWYASETSLTTSNVNANTFAKIGSLPVAGKVYAQPLYVTNEATSDGLTHNLVLVASAQDKVYAYDEAAATTTTPTPVWVRDFTNASAGITQQLASQTSCSDVNPDTGIVATPVIDRSLNAMYVVVPTLESGTSHLRLHAISLANGADLVAPVEITASVISGTKTFSVNPTYNFPRAALLEANGNIYVSLGSHCDYSQSITHGWLLSYDRSTLAMNGNALDTTGSAADSNYLGSIWMSGFGPAADSSGNLYFVTGNGPFNGSTDFSMSVVKAPGTLALSGVSFFSPIGESADSQVDADLGSGGVILLPDQPGTYPHLAVTGGKCGAGSSSNGTQGCVKYVLNRDALGGQTSGDSGALVHMDTGGGEWGGPATFQDAAGKTYVVMGTGAPLNQYTVGTNPVSLTVTAQVNVGCLECKNYGSQPVVSSNGTTAGTAVVWALKTPGNSGGNISLYAFNATTMATLFNGVAGVWTKGSSFSAIGGAMVSPLVANGRVFVPTDGSVGVFGLH